MTSNTARVHKMLLLSLTCLSVLLCRTEVIFAFDGAAPSVAAVKTLMETGETPVRIVCFGDSITGVYYHTGSRRAWCDMLGIALRKAYPKAKIEMINAGISGHTTVAALARIDKDVIARKPQLVVVKFGMNDVARIKPDKFHQNLRTIVDRCHAAGAAVVLCTPNSVIENTARPNVRLKDFSTRIRKVASAQELVLVDLFSAWQEIRRQDEIAWTLLMSDAIHPNMNGHKRFAELIAKGISGRKVVLGNVKPPRDGLYNTFNRLHAGQPVKLIAMPPYDRLMQDALREHYPDAEFEVTEWPVEGKSLAELNVWAKRIRAAAPHLVVVAVPATATDKNDSTYINNYEWVLNWSFHFARRPWDVLPILPTVAGSPKNGEGERLSLARKVVIGKDVQFIDRGDDDKRPVAELLADWVLEQKKMWKANPGS